MILFSSERGPALLSVESLARVAGFPLVLGTEEMRPRLSMPKHMGDLAFYLASLCFVRFGKDYN